jgi:hypothetical protein
LFQVLRDEPWMCRAWYARPLANPHALAYQEYCLRVLEPTGLGIEAMMNVANLLQGYAVQAAAGVYENELTSRHYADLSPEILHEFVLPALNRAINCGRFPTYARWLSECGVHHDGIQSFEYGLDRLLTGIAADLPPAS